MKKHIFGCIAFLCTMVAYAQTGKDNITLDLANTNLADALVKIDKASTTKRVQFIYNELDSMPVNVKLSHLTIDNAVLYAIGSHPVYVYFTPTDIYVESQVHDGDSKISKLMTGMKWGIELDNVTITNRKQYSDHGTHLTVIPRQQDVKASDRSIMLLSMIPLPGLRVDPALGKITIDGGTPVFMVNGKERSRERFNNLDPTKILRIEYSNNPGIRYLDRGATGVINIVLREAEDGGSATAHAQSAFTTGFVNGYANASYHKGRSEFTLEYNANYRNYDDDPMMLIEQFISAEKNISRDTRGNTLMSYLNQNISAEYTYQHNDSTMFVASFGTWLHNFHNRQESDVMTIYNDLPKDYNLYRKANSLQCLPKLDLYFKHKMKHQQEIEFNVVNEWAGNEQNVLKRQTYNTGEVIEYPVMVQNNGWAISSEAVYSKQIGKHKVRTGIQYQYNYARNDYEEQDVVSRMYKNNGYVFGELQGQLSEKVNYSIGTGLKAFKVQENENDKFYLRNLSTARLGWRINDHWTLVTDLSYVPHLPSLSDLTTVFQPSDDIEAMQGNANLKPSSTLRTHLTARYQSGGPFYANIYFCNDHTFDAILFNTIYDAATGYFVERPENSTYFNGMWQQAEFGVKDLWGHLTISADVAWKHQESKGKDFHYTRRFVRSDINASYVYNNFVTGCGFNITPDWDLNGETYNRAERQQYIYAQYKHKQWTFNLTWHCPFNPKGYVYKSECWSKVHPLTCQNNTGNNGNMIVLGVTWQANFGKSFKKSQKTLQNGGYDSGIVR